MLRRIEVTSARRSAASGLAAEVEAALAPVGCQLAREGFFLLVGPLRQDSLTLFHYLFRPSCHSPWSRFYGSRVWTSLMPPEPRVVRVRFGRLRQTPRPDR